MRLRILAYKEPMDLHQTNIPANAIMRFTMAILSSTILLGSTSATSYSCDKGLAGTDLVYACFPPEQPMNILDIAQSLLREITREIVPGVDFPEDSRAINIQGVS